MAEGGAGGTPVLPVACENDTDCPDTACGRGRCGGGTCVGGELEQLWEIPVPEARWPGDASPLMAEGDRLVWSAAGWLFVSSFDGARPERTFAADGPDSAWLVMVSGGQAILGSSFGVSARSLEDGRLLWSRVIVALDVVQQDGGALHVLTRGWLARMDPGTGEVMGYDPVDLPPYYYSGELAMDPSGFLFALVEDRSLLAFDGELAEVWSVDARGPLLGVVAPFVIVPTGPRDSFTGDLAGPERPAIDAAVGGEDGWHLVSRRDGGDAIAVELERRTPSWELVDVHTLRTEDAQAAVALKILRSGEEAVVIESVGARGDDSGKAARWLLLPREAGADRCRIAGDDTVELDALVREGMLVAIVETEASTAVRAFAVPGLRAPAPGWQLPRGNEGRTGSPGR